MPFTMPTDQRIEPIATLRSRSAGRLQTLPVAGHSIGTNEVPARTVPVGRGRAAFGDSLPAPIPTSQMFADDEDCALLDLHTVSLYDHPWR